MSIKAYYKYLFMLAATMFIFIARPIDAKADSYNLWVGGTQVTDDNKANILGNNTASYNSDTKSLTLTGANITNGHIFDYYSHGIYSELEQLTVTGYGTISNCNVGIASNKDNATLTVNGTGTGLNISAASFGIHTYKPSETLNLEGNITAEATGGSSRGVFSSGTVNIVNGTLSVKGSWGIETGYSDGVGHDINIGADVTKVTATVYYSSDVYHTFRTFGNININPALSITTPAGGRVGYDSYNSAKVILASDGTYPETVVIEPVSNNNNNSGSNNDNNTSNNSDNNTGGNNNNNTSNSDSNTSNNTGNNTDSNNNSNTNSSENNTDSNNNNNTDNTANNTGNDTNNNDNNNQTPDIAPSNSEEPSEIVDLPGIKISKVTVSSKSVTVKWKKLSKKNQKKVTKIQVQYSTDKNFKKNVKTVNVKKASAEKKIKNLSRKKTYYIRIRTYNKKSDGLHVSKWSKVKKIKIK